MKYTFTIPVEITLDVADNDNGGGFAVAESTVREAVASIGGEVHGNQSGRRAAALKDEIVPDAEELRLLSAAARNQSTRYLEQSATCLHPSAARNLLRDAKRLDILSQRLYLAATAPSPSPTSR